MKKLLFFAALVCCTMLNANATITKESACAIVQSCNVGNNFAYYTSSVDRNYILDKIEPNQITQYSWLLEDTTFWMVFVDKEFGKGWYHDCTYYYLPKNVSISVDNLLRIDSNMPPNDLNLEFMSSDVNPIGYTLNKKSNSYYYGTRLYPFLPVDSLPGKTKAIIIGTGMNRLASMHRHWNDCALMYNTLHHNYQLPDSDISLFVCSGSKNVQIFMDENNLHYPIDMSFDLDNDGVDENIRRADKNTVETVMDSIAQYSEPIDHLILYFAGDVQPCITPGFETSYNLCLYNSTITASQLNQLITDIDAKYCTIIINCNNSEYFIPQFESPGRVVMADAAIGQGSGIYTDVQLNIFTLEWAAAMNGINFINEVADADYNEDNYISIKESYNFVYNRMNEMTYGNIHPFYSSQLASTGEDLCINRLPMDVDLYLRDYINDTGSYPADSSEIYWSSPDIWIRNQNDGIINQQSEIITGENDTIYIYSKIQNRGKFNYLGDGSDTLKLSWVRNNLMLNQSIVDSDTLLGGFISSIPITTPILSDSSAVICCAWQVPQRLLSLVGYTGGILPISVVGEIIDDSIPSINNRLMPYLCNNIALKKETIMNPSTGTLRKTYVGSDPIANKIILSGVQIPIYIYNDNVDPSNVDIYVIPDSLNCDSTAFESVELAIVLPDSIYTYWSQEKEGFIVDTTQPKRLIMDNMNCHLTGLYLKSNQLDSLILSCHIDARKTVLRTQTHKFHVFAYKNNQLIDALSCKIIIEPRNIISPIIIRSTNNDDKDIISASNILEPVYYQWYDNDGNILGDTDSLPITINRTGNMTYNLKVIAESDGAVSYANTTIESPSLADIIYDKGSIFITLLNQNFSSGTIQVTSLYNQIQSQSFNVNPNNSQYIISMDNKPAGAYVVSIIIDGILIASQTIML